MSSRSRGRQYAVQLIYQFEFSDDSFEIVRERFWKNQEQPISSQSFADELAQGVLEHREELDLELSGYLDKWTLDRLISLNRIILEIGLYELKFLAEKTPWKVAIDEAVMLARAFSGEEHTNFVNGVLHNWYMKNRATS